MTHSPDSKAQRAADRARARVLVEEGGVLERQGHFPQAWSALAEGAELNHRSRGTLPPGPIWDGRLKAGQSILIRRLMRHAGAQLRMARLIPTLQALGMRVSVLAEPRLLPLFARSFPGISLFAEDGEPDPQLASLPWASYERVAEALWTSQDAISERVTPLCADSKRTAQLRANYQAGGAEPLVGLSWWSSNGRKDLPAPQDIAAEPKSWPGRPVSLQYSPGEAGLSDLVNAFEPGRLVVDQELDPIADLDGFAAQVAAMDIVVTVSNTTVHMAGALGVPCVMLMDDGDHLIWPPKGTRSVFYESLTILRRNGRPWSEVWRAGLDTARAALASPSKAATTPPAEKLP